jgi:hypothetical protein
VTEKRLTATWMAAVVLTVGSWGVATASGHVHGDVLTVAALLGLVLAGIKVRLIVRTFMEVHGAPAWLRRFTDGWLVTLLVALGALYLAS